MAEEIVHTFGINFFLNEAFVSLTQAVPDEEPLSYTAFSSPDATATFGLSRVLSEVIHRNPLLHLLLS